jgi:DNA-binding transcriptional LysR family regulator
MRLDLLETYHAILGTGTTQGAALRLGISQSAVSRRLTQFEESLGLTLFQRVKSRLIPTRDSLLMRDQIDNLLESSIRLKTQVDALRSGNSSAVTLRVAFPGSLGLTIVPRIMNAFLRDHDQVKLELHTGPYDMIERMLLDGRAELGFIRLPATRPGLKTYPAVASRTVCVMPADHPLAARKIIAARDLRDEPMILLGRMRAPRREIDTFFADAGLTPNVRIEAHSVSSACGLVANGLGVTLVNELMAMDYADLALAIRPLAQTIPHSFAFAVAERDPIGTIAEAFIKIALAEFCANLPGQP